MWIECFWHEFQRIDSNEVFAVRDEPAWLALARLLHHSLHNVYSHNHSTKAPVSLGFAALRGRAVIVRIVNRGDVKSGSPGTSGIAKCPLLVRPTRVIFLPG